jgi:hypothetical protein
VPSAWSLGTVAATVRWTRLGSAWSFFDIYAISSSLISHSESVTLLTATPCLNTTKVGRSPDFVRATLTHMHAHYHTLSHRRDGLFTKLQSVLREQEQECHRDTIALTVLALRSPGLVSGDDANPFPWTSEGHWQHMTCSDTERAPWNHQERGGGRVGRNLPDCDDLRHVTRGYLGRKTIHISILFSRTRHEPAAQRPDSVARAHRQK